MQISAPEGSSPDLVITPPRGSSPGPSSATDFNAAAYLQRKSAIHPSKNASSLELTAQLHRKLPLDHRIRAPAGGDFDDGQAAESFPLLQESP